VGTATDDSRTTLPNGGFLGETDEQQFSRFSESATLRHPMVSENRITNHDDAMREMLNFVAKGPGPLQDISVLIHENHRL
jgi:hypothetical protein